jgi:hypothetical protein
MTTIQKIQIIVNTLNQVTVSGKKNLDYLLGSIQTLEQVMKEMEAASNDETPD